MRNTSNREALKSVAHIAPPVSPRRFPLKSGGVVVETHMQRSNTSPLIALTFALGTLGLAACNTVEGAGEDIQQAGEQIEETAEETHDGNPNTP
jgi:predicted small secreted protein